MATICKTVVAIPSGSVGLIAEAAHSAVDVVSSGIAFLSVRYSAKPADREHPYGHGKIEAVSGFVESILLVGTAGPIIYGAINRLIAGTGSPRIETGLIIMFLSAVSSLLVGWRVKKIGQETQSPALKGNANHLFADAATSFGVLLGLAAVKLTGWTRADALVGLILGAWMILGGLRAAYHTTQDLLDRAIPDEELNLIRAEIERFPGVQSYHKLRARHVGAVHEVDVHVVVPRDWTVVQAHDLAHGLEKVIETTLSPARAIVHIDPAED